MRLLFLATDFPNRYEPHKGVFNRSLVRALAARHEVRVIAPIPWPVRRRAAGPDPAAGEPYPVRYPTYYYPPKVGRHRYDAFYGWSIRRAVRETLTDFHPDAVMAYWAHPDGAVAARVARRIGAQSAVIVGGSDVMLLPQVPRRRRAVEQALGAVDAVLTVSDSLRRKAIDLGVDPARAFVWRQGLDTTKFYLRDKVEARRRLGLPDDRPLLVWVGRLVPVKGLDVLLDACGRLRTDGPPFRVMLVGDGPLRPALEAQARTLGLAEVVTFVGARDHTELPDWYAAADWTLLPSRSEGLPNVLRESLACGTPFIASDVGGVSEIVGDSGSRLVPPGDSAAWAAAIRAALAGPAPRPNVRPASWDESAAALVDVLQSVEPAVVQQRWQLAEASL